MKRRRILQASLGLATWPIAGCAPAAVPVPPALPPAPAPPPPPPVASASAAAPPAAPPPPPLAPAPGISADQRVVARVGSNHGHTLVVAREDVLAAVDKTYDLTGTAAHGHSVTITEAQFREIAGGAPLRTSSTANGHIHRLLIKTAPAVDPPELANVCDIKIGGKDDHELAIPAAHIADRRDRTYEIQGIAPHSHALRVTAADFDRLARGGELAITTGPATPGEDHTHVVFIRHPARPR